MLGGEGRGAGIGGKSAATQEGTTTTAPTSLENGEMGDSCSFLVSRM